MTFSWLIRNFGSKCYHFRPDIAKTLFPKGMQFDDKQLYFQALIDRFRIAFIKFNKVAYEVLSIAIVSFDMWSSQLSSSILFQKGNSL